MDNIPSSVLTWLENTPVLAEISDSKEREAFQSLVGHEGFRLFLGLMLGARQTFYTQLAALPLNGMENAARASVIQGQIKGIDLARQTVVEFFSPVGDPTKGA